MGFIRVASLLALAACANARMGTGPEDAAVDGTGNRDGGGIGCKPGELVTEVKQSGDPICAAPTSAIQTALDASCGVYFGWRDSCDGCTTPPAKWGRAAGTTCVNGAGVNDTCTMQTLGVETATMFGLDPDGDVDSNDKLYWSLHCAAAAPTVSTAPCKPGEYVDGKIGASWTCSPIANAVVGYIHDHCALYAGWQDSCDGCTRVPAKWGYAGGTTCMNGAGGDDTCTTTTLGTESVTLFGLNPDGNVNDDDKIHVGLHCTAANAATSSSSTGCPTGQFVVGVRPDGSFDCESVAPLVVGYFSDRCSIDFGWRDSCDGCPGPPAKWGRVRVGFCENGTGANDTCTTFMLGGQSVAMFGLNPDGDVDGNDAFYVSFQCR